VTLTLKTTRGTHWMRWLMHPIGKTLLGLALGLFLVFGLAFIHYYNEYAAVIDARLSAPIFSQTSILFAAPKSVAVGEALTPTEVSSWLLRAGYSNDRPSPVGTFTVNAETIVVHPGPEAYHALVPVTIHFGGKGDVDSIVNSRDQTPLDHYDLEPELVTSLFDAKREKRRLVHYEDLPPTLVAAVLDIEDKDFFHHGAVEWRRVPAAMFRDVKSRRREQGASTITMQVARNIFDLGSQRTFRRKLTETLVAMELEERLTKEQIFELYANQLYLGRRGSYSIHGFGEAADAYFGKDVRQLNLPECALLAGIIHGPNPDSPYRHPDRARRRRDEVLAAMVKNHAITPAQREAATVAPLVLTAANSDASDAPYFVDMVRDRISDQVSEHDLSTGSYRIYSTIDPDLQAAAARAVAVGMKGVDAELAELRAHQRHPRKGPQQQAQAALVAIDPHTGAVLALVGGRNYAASQLNHAVAERPTGSIFKPFVYATALETGLLGNLTPITQTSQVMDRKTTFEGGYSPGNFENKYYGEVTLRTALEHSLNNATITLAEEVGLRSVTDLAHAAGIVNAQPTPSEAIGTYTATPLQMAGAYTVFANAGVREMPHFVNSVQTAAGDDVFKQNLQPKAVLDPRIAFLTTNLLESVLDKGTAVRARETGFDEPAAAKTGSSHDAWFAGYTSNLLCIVWVGLDDYENLNIEGAHAALPIWTEFMKSAAKLPAYHDMEPFKAPPGVVPERIDTESNQLATPLCPPSQVETDYYLSGSQPTQMCRFHPSNLTPRGVIAGTLNFFHITSPNPAPPPPSTPPPQQIVIPTPQAETQTPAPTKPPPPPKKKGLFGKIFGALKGGGGGDH